MYVCKSIKNSGHNGTTDRLHLQYIYDEHETDSWLIVEKRFEHLFQKQWHLAEKMELGLK